MFEITILQKTLMDCLNLLSHTVGNNNNQLGDNCISMECNGNSVVLYTTNTVEFSYIDVVVSNGNTGTAPYVDFKRFRDIISSIPGNEYITIKKDGINALAITFAMRKPIILNGCNNGFLLLPNVSSQNGTPVSTIEVPFESIKDVLSSAANIIEDSVSTPIYNCICIETDNNDMNISGIDFNTRRMFCKSKQCNISNPKARILIEASKLNKNIKMFSNYYDLEITDNGNIVCVNGINCIQQTDVIETKYYSRIVSGAFPRGIHTSLLKGADEYIEVDKTELKNSIKRAKSIEDNISGQKIIYINVSGNNFNISTKSSYGQLDDDIKANNSVTKDMHMIFKYEQLTDILNSIDEEELKIGKLTGSNGHYIIEPKHNNTKVYSISELIP